MAWQDEVAQIRADLRQSRSQQQFQESSAKSQDIDGLLGQMKEMALAQYMNGQKSTVVLTDQTDLGDKFSELTKELTTIVGKLDSSETDSKQLAELKSIYGVLDSVKTELSKDTNLDKSFSRLTAAINSLSIDVPAPKVTVTAPKVDFTPLQDTIREYFKPEETEKVDLEDYRAQDLIDGTDKQYVGFVNPDGGWYIIENDVKANKLRYVFGSSNYTKAWKKASSYQYMLLNEAIDEISA